MTLDDVRRILDAELILGDGLERITVEMGCAADLMSDVLAFGESGALLLTGLTNPQVIRTAEMADAVGVCFVRGKHPPEETVALARRSELPIIVTALPMFESCGRLYQNGLRGCDSRGE